MSEQEQITRARLVDGTVYVQQDDGSWREAVGKTNWDRVRAFTDEEIERIAEEDGTADMPDTVRAVWPVQVEPV